MTDVVLARHGQTRWHLGNRYTGSSDIGLDGRGAAQARLLAGWAERYGVTDLACTPLTRSRATAEAVAVRTGLSPVVLSALREIDFGVAEGSTMAELRESHPHEAAAFMADPVGAHWPGGDDPAERTAEAVTELTSWALRCGDRPLVVAHSTLVRLLVCHTLGIPLSDYRRRLPTLRPTGMTVLRVGAGADWSLIAYNLGPGENDAVPAD